MSGPSPALADDGPNVDVNVRVLHVFRRNAEGQEAGTR